jgi:hypothetical protein
VSSLFGDSMKTLISSFFVFVSAFSAQGFAQSINCYNGTTGYSFEETEDSFILKIRDILRPNSLFLKLGAISSGTPHELKLVLAKNNAEELGIRSCLHSDGDFLLLCYSTDAVREFTLTNMFSGLTINVPRAMVQFSSSHEKRNYLVRAIHPQTPPHIISDDVLKLYFYTSTSIDAQDGISDSYAVNFKTCKLEGL